GYVSGVRRRHHLLQTTGSFSCPGIVGYRSAKTRPFAERKATTSDTTERPEIGGGCLPPTASARIITKAKSPVAIQKEHNMRMLADKIVMHIAMAGLAASLLWMAGMAWSGETPKEGKPAPEVKLPAALPDGKTGTVDLKEYKGKKHVVLYFFPKALTGG